MFLGCDLVGEIERRGGSIREKGIKDPMKKKSIALKSENLHLFRKESFTPDSSVLCKRGRIISLRRKKTTKREEGSRRGRLEGEHRLCGLWRQKGADLMWGPEQLEIHCGGGGEK